MTGVRYKTRPGVVLTSIQGEYLLVSAKRAREFCPYVTGINETAAFIWRLLENDCDFDSVIRKIAEEYEITDLEDVEQNICQLITSLADAGYLI